MKSKPRFGSMFARATTAGRRARRAFSTAFPGSSAPSSDNFGTKFAQAERDEVNNLLPQLDPSSTAASANLALKPSRRLSVAGLLSAVLIACAWLFAGGATTTASAQDPAPARGYELVSPLPTEGVPFPGHVLEVAAGEDGDHVSFRAGNPFPGSQALPDEEINGFWSYISSRTASGWGVEDIGLAFDSPGDQSFQGAGLSRDGSRFLSRSQSELDPDDQNGELAWDVYQYQPDGSLTWISRDPRIPAGTPQTDPAHARVATVSLVSSNMSVDGRTVVIESRRQLADSDTTPGASTSRLYKRDDGDLTFIGKRPDGSVPIGGTEVGSDKNGLGGDNSTRGAVSRDGSRVVFTADRVDGSDGRGLYIQTDGEPTVEATKETGVPPLPAGEPFPPGISSFTTGTVYRGASADASRVFYTSSSRLTADSGAQATPGGEVDLYVYDIDADKVRDLTPKLGPDPDGTAADRAAVQGVAANSEDGKRIYFVAEGAYPGADPAPNGDTPADNDNNLYLAELDGIDDAIDLKFIAALGNGDDGVWGSEWDSNKTSYASPDGSVLGFGSSQDDLTDDAKDDDLNGTEQLYVYDAATHSLDCASCPADGSLPTGDVNPPQEGIGSSSDWQWEFADKRWISSQDEVFFDTAVPLLPEDHNSEVDVYGWQDGQLELISSGLSADASRLENASRDGSTVFFTTSETLVPRDNEPGIPKLYAARVGGGFPPPPTPPAPCEGDECKDDVPDAPADDNSATGGTGAGNPTPTPSCDSQKASVDRYDDRIAKLKDNKKRAKRKAKQASGKKAQRKRQRAKRIGKKIRKVRGKKRDAKRDLRACRGGSQ